MKVNIIKVEFIERHIVCNVFPGNIKESCVIRIEVHIKCCDI